MDAAASSSSSSSAAVAAPSAGTSLPDRKRFIATLGGGAFFLGLTGATIYGLRKARAQALKEAQEAALSASAAQSPAIASVPSSSSSSAAATSSTISVLRKAPTTTAAAAAPTSVFDDASNSTLPGVLRRRTATTQKPTPVSAHPHLVSATVSSSAANPSSSSSTAISGSTSPSPDSKIDYSEMDSTLDFFGLSTPQTASEKAQGAGEGEGDGAEERYRPMSFGETPVGLSLKAFATATAIVLGSAAVVVETTRRVMDVHSLDEVVLRMSTIVPSRSSGAEALSGISPSLRTTTTSSSSSSSPSTTATPVAGGEGERAAPKPMSVQETMDALGAATSLEAWLTTLKTQLDAERDDEVARRFANLAAYQDHVRARSEANDGRHVNDSISRSYDIHSPLEDVASSSSSPPSLTMMGQDQTPNKLSSSRYTLSISPLLPLSAFGFGFVSGLTSAGKRASLVFMAENAHRLPDTVQGWYFYSKTKNYRILLRGIQGGIRQGARLSVWTTGFCIAERLSELGRGALGEFLDRLRRDPHVGVAGGGGGNDNAVVVAVDAAHSASKFLGHWTDGSVAGLVTATAAVSLYQLTKTPAIRVLQLGVLAGGLTGALRDAQERLVHREIGGVASHT
ncbi:uncharacterized protein PFL1_03527 [Pseudozyma flocculosa PF-1]|uniref:Uncharacterized protein n=1 Tax=Pseudozyma flocculosa PF-1 TaxID=1277687 RepID=A0A061H7V0_9BASI|nr:uncharacterized protein PFL1_03527 [Pseudozyma flocculosa PF-1]EPQ28723.1 hypothetical protein PFL1_03527 [Pseudozyma flocculosa PF-1]